MVWEHEFLLSWFHIEYDVYIIRLSFRMHLLQFSYRAEQAIELTDEEIRAITWNVIARSKRQGTHFISSFEGIYKPMVQLRAGLHFNIEKEVQMKRNLKKLFMIESSFFKAHRSHMTL